MTPIQPPEAWGIVRPAFIPCSSWMEALFDRIPQETVPVNRLSDGGLRFAAVSLLLRHEALSSRESLTLSAATLESRASELDCIFACLEHGWPKGLFLAAKLSGVGKPGFRTQRVRVVGGFSPLINRFEPPKPDEVWPACRELRRHLMLVGSRAPSIERALLGSMVLLTVHPFPDGNGRMARHLFASWLKRYGYTNPALLSAFARCFFDGARSLQLALSAMRLGDPTQVVDLYWGCFDNARHELELLHRELPYGTVDGRPALESLRTHFAEGLAPKPLHPVR